MHTVTVPSSNSCESWTMRDALWCCIVMIPWWPDGNTKLKCTTVGWQCNVIPSLNFKFVFMSPGRLSTLFLNTDNNKVKQLHRHDTRYSVISSSMNVQKVMGLIFKVTAPWQMQLPQILYFTVLEALSFPHMQPRTHSNEHVHTDKHTPYMSRAHILHNP